MKIAKLKIKNCAKRKSFALIYTLLFIVLLLLTVSVTWFTGMADIRLARRTEYSTEAMQLAKSAIDEGWVKYKNEVGTALSINQVTFPTGTPNNACTNPNPVVHRVVVNSNGTFTETDPRLTAGVNLALNGVYDYRVCYTATPYQIEGIGYYKGNKITLQGTIAHKDQMICQNNSNSTISTKAACDSSTETQTGWDHSADYLTITQTGPSK